MPLTFLNGGAPNYLGFNFTDSITLLTQMHTTLVAAGLTSITNTPASNIIELEFNATDNADTCAIRIETDIPQSGVLRLSITMAHTSTYAVSSNVYYAFGTDGQQNRLWLTANQDHLAMCVQNFGGLCTGLHAGYLLRLDSSDTYAFALGIPSSSVYRDDGFGGQSPTGDKVNYTIAQAYHDGTTNWFNPANGFRQNLVEAGGTYPRPGVGPYFGCGFINRHASCLMPFSSTISTSASNAGRNNTAGNVNGLNNKSILGEYFAVEGRILNNDYGSGKGELAPSLYFRGVVQNVVVGMSHLIDGTQIEAVTGERYITTGGLTYQGIRIA